jgi:hypothetical protein
VPSAKTLRQLYVLSGNQCANPACATVLINANGTLVADVCHIKAEKPGGARYDKKLSADKRRAAENLVLLCGTCHTLVDREPRKYTVKVLTNWKRDREDRFAGIGDTLRQRYVGEIVDDAETAAISVPRTQILLRNDWQTLAVRIATRNQSASASVSRMSALTGATGVSSYPRLWGRRDAI